MRLHPPDHDPELRRVFALDADAQCAELQRLLGGDQACPPPAAAGPIFKHVGVRLHTTPRGSLVCRPDPFPDEAILHADARRLCIIVDHYELDHVSMPRTPEGIAALRAKVDTLAPRRGIVLLPYAPPCTWTVQTVRDLIALLAQHVPADPSSSAPRFHVWAPTGCYHDRARLIVHRGSWFAEICIRPDASPALRRWDGASGSMEWADQVLRDMEPPVSPAPVANTHRDDDEDDDDLDAIERVARRTLHPIIDTLRDAVAELAAETVTPEADSLRRIGTKLRQIAQSRPRALPVFESLLDHWLADHASKDRPEGGA